MLVGSQHGKLDEAVENLLTLEKQCRLVRSFPTLHRNV